MSEAPKKIWLNPQEECWGVKQWTPFDTPYIRADIVDELVEALKELVDLIDNDYEVDSLTTQPSRAALKKLEDGHE